MTNKYSTIIYTDVVGYSRLTGEDQELALELLSEHDKILHQYTKHYNGNIIKETGDGICAMFDNPVNAIKCSIDIQKDLNKRNQLNSKNRQVQIRIGIHYGTYVIKDSEVYGDTINISKLIEASAPHGGIAISKEVNDLVWNVNDIYTRKYIEIEYAGDKIQLFEVYTNLIDWYKNAKSQEPYVLNYDKAYKNAHDCFHLSDYSTSLKYASLALFSAKKNRIHEVQSFICHLFISLGEYDVGEKELSKFKRMLSNDIDIELEAHLLKMEGNLYLNNNKWSKSEDALLKALDIMDSINNKYSNELIFNLGNVYLYSDKLEKITEVLDRVVIKDEYSILISGFNLIINNSKNFKELDKYISLLKEINNPHLKAFGFLYSAIYCKNIKDLNKSQLYISKAQELLISASEKISDWYQREKFIKDIFMHEKIMNFHDDVHDDYSDLDDLLDLSSEDVELMDKKNTTESVFKFCTECGEKNNNYKFCIHCGNNLQC